MQQALTLLFSFFFGKKNSKLELKKSGKFCFYLCEFLPAMSSVESSSKFNLLWFRLVRVRTGLLI